MWMRQEMLTIAAFITLTLGWTGPAWALQTAGFEEVQVATGLNSPTAMEFSPDGRLFVAQQSGRLRVIKNGSLLPDDFVTLSVTSNGERGLLGIAFDPAFSSNRYIYLYYTRAGADPKNRVSRFTASSSNPDVVQAGSELVILDNIASDAGNHNGGAIHFGLDGKLYVATGDGGATASNSQSLSNLSGQTAAHQSGWKRSVGQPLCRNLRRPRRDLGPGTAQPVHVCRGPSDRQNPYQRCGSEYVGRDQCRRQGSQLRLAGV